MANSSRRDWIAIAISVLALSLTVAQYLQAKKLFDLTGPVVTVKPSAQLTSKDGSREEKLSQEEQPVLLARDFENYGPIYLVFEVENIGREATTLLGAKLRIAGNTVITHDNHQASALCAAQAGRRIDCREAMANPPNLSPGQSYYFYFPLKAFWDKIPDGADLQGEIRATAMSREFIMFGLGIRVEPLSKPEELSPPGSGPR